MGGEGKWQSYPRFLFYLLLLDKQMVMLVPKGAQSSDLKNRIWEFGDLARTLFIMDPSNPRQLHN